jgi:hypothetical protein
VTEKLKSATVIIGEMMVAVIIGDEVTAGTKGMPQLGRTECLLSVRVFELLSHVIMLM